MDGMRLDRRAFVAGALSAAAASSAAQAQVTRVEAPFRLRDNQPLTQATINGFGPYWLLIDTGATGFALQDAICREARLRPIGTGRAQGAVGRTREFTVFEAAEIFVAGGIRETRVQVGGGFPANTGRRFVGLFPMPRGAAEIGMDFDRSRFIVDQRPADSHPGFDQLPVVVETASRVRTSREFADPRPRVQVSIDGRPSTLLLDTGANGTLFLKPDYVRRHNLFAASTRYRDGASMGVAGAFRTRQTQLASLEIGRFRFIDLPVRLGHPDDAGRDGWGGYDGLLGIEVLRRLNFFIRPRRDELYIAPNQRLGDVFRVDRSGLSLTWTDGKVVVAGVAAGSPAARLDLQTGDVIVASSAGDGSHDGLVFALSDAPGTEIRMAVRRGDAVSREVTITLDDGYDRG